MIVEPNCYKRECRFYLGVKNDGDAEVNERSYCAAYLDGIPDDISYGKDKHLKVRADQDNDIVFEKIKLPWKK